MSLTTLKKALQGTPEAGKEKDPKKLQQEEILKFLQETNQRTAIIHSINIRETTRQTVAYTKKAEDQLAFMEKGGFSDKEIEDLAALIKKIPNSEHLRLKMEQIKKEKYAMFA